MSITLKSGWDKHHFHKLVLFDISFSQQEKNVTHLKKRLSRTSFSCIITLWLTQFSAGKNMSITLKSGWDKHHFHKLVLFDISFYQQKKNVTHLKKRLRRTLIFIFLYILTNSILCRINKCHSIQKVVEPNINLHTLVRFDLRYSQQEKNVTHLKKRLSRTSVFMHYYSLINAILCRIKECHSIQKVVEMNINFHIFVRLLTLFSAGLKNFTHIKTWLSRTSVFIR